MHSHRPCSQHSFERIMTGAVSEVDDKRVFEQAVLFERGVIHLAEDLSSHSRRHTQEFKAAFRGVHQSEESQHLLRVEST